MKRLVFFVIAFFAFCRIYSQTISEAETFFNNGSYNQALEVYDKLLKSSPNDLMLKYRKARCCILLKQYDVALPLLEEAERRKFVKANYYLYDVYFNLYKFSEAAEAMRKYIELRGETLENPEECQEKIRKAEMGIDMLSRVENIAIADSVKIAKTHFLEAYRLPKELGTLSFYSNMSLYEFGMGIPHRSGSEDPHYSTLAAMGYDLPDLPVLKQSAVVFTSGREDKRIFPLPDENGDIHLSISYKLYDGWSHPTMLSDVLNSSACDNYPFEMADGVTIYFASNGENSIGGYDIFMSRFNGDDYSKPLNIGMPFNSPDNDYMLVIDEMAGIGWFATDRRQHPDTVVVYEFVPNEKRLPLKTEDPDYRRKVAQLILSRKAHFNNAVDKTEVEKVENNKNEINFRVNDGVLYTQLSDFHSEDAKALYLKLVEVDKRYQTLKILLEGKRREYTFAESYQDKEVIRVEVLEIEAEVRRYAALVDEYILQVRRAEINAIINN